MMTVFKIHLKKVITILFVMFFVTTLLIPVAFFNKLFFLIMIGLLLFKLSGKSILYTFSPIIIFIIFFYGFIMSLFNNVDRGLSIQMLTSVFLLFLIYPIERYKIDLDRIVKLSGIILSISTGLFYFILFMGNGAAYEQVFMDIFNKYSSGAFGVREYGEEMTFMFHLGTVPFLFLPFSLYCIAFFKDRKLSHFFAMLIIMGAIISSASRGLIFVSLLSFLGIIFLNFKMVPRIILLFISLPLIIFVLQYFILNTTVFSSDEVSNNAKIGHLTSFFNNLNLKNFIIGDGLATYHFTTGSNSLKAQTEITPLDMFRYFGFILTLLLYAAIIFPSRKLKAYSIEKGKYTMIFFLYVVLSFTNPIFFNSFGLLVVLWYWSKILAFKRNKSMVNL